MDKMVVVAFDDEGAAAAGLRSLWDLHGEGSITLYAASVIARGADGSVLVRKTADQGPVGAAFGLATGSLVGLLGAPAAAAGSLYDLANIGVNVDFLLEVSRALLPGRCAVVAELDEEWITPLDMHMELLGGQMLRRARGEYVDIQLEREIEAEQAELDELKGEYKAAGGTVQQRLEHRIIALERRLRERRDAADVRIAALKREEERKIHSLEEQAAHAHGQRRERVAERIARARAQHLARVSKLDLAWSVVRETADP